MKEFLVFAIADELSFNDTLNQLFLVFKVATTENSDIFEERAVEL